MRQDTAPALTSLNYLILPGLQVSLDSSVHIIPNASYDKQGKQHSNALIDYFVKNQDEKYAYNTCAYQE